MIFPVAPHPPHHPPRPKARNPGPRPAVLALYLAIRHPATPWYAKLLAAGVVVYALSPFDLIPDPIPVLGYLDDIVIVPLGVLAVRWMIPPTVLDQCRSHASTGVPINPAWKWLGAALIAALWLLCLFWLITAARQWSWF